MDAITIANYEEHHNLLRDQFKEFSQRKSDFQVEKFTACSDGIIPSHQYRHTLTQIRVCLTELKRRIIDRERHIRSRDRATEQKLEDWDLDVAVAETEIESLTYDIDSKLIEINRYNEILSHLEKEHGKSFTNEEYQSDEPEYWRRRFARQLHDSVIDRQTGCGQGNLVALREACYDPILPNSPNQLDVLPMDTQSLNAISNGTNVKQLKTGE
jgi:signal transduction histidine kinase